MTTHMRPRVAVTLGDPGGIGGELVARLIASTSLIDDAHVVLISDPEELEQAMFDAGSRFDYSEDPAQDSVPVLINNAAYRPGSFERRVATEAGGRWALQNLRTALELSVQGAVDAIVFAPLNKSSLHLAGMRELDEMHWFETVLDNGSTATELNILPELMTARVTSHIPLSDVAAGITEELVIERGQLLNRMLLGAGVEHPRIGVCALNPHAGESGRFGREEIDVISPAVARLAECEVDAKGPFPADTIFLRAKNGEFDGILTMYHDQGQIAMKMIGFDRGVTMAGGLNVPICTPAHGTAFDLVGTGRADTGAMEHAFALACRLGRQRREAAGAQ